MTSFLESLTDYDPLSLAADLLDPVPDIYFYNPRQWILDHFDWNRVGKLPTEYQQDIDDLLIKHKRLAVKGPHGLGKTAKASWIVLWFANTREAAGKDWKVITTASAWRQLEVYLWPEIHKWARLLLWDKLGRKPYDRKTELLKLSLNLRYGAATAVSSDDPQAIEGAHADCLLYVLDESKAIVPKTWEAVEGAFSNAGESTEAEAYAFSISTPGEPNGTFFDIMTRKAGTEDWGVRSVLLEEAIKAGRVSPEWVEQRKLQWGETSAVFKNRVLGEFSTIDEQGLIQLSHIEAAVERWEEFHRKADWESKLPNLTSLGVDVARSGEDKTNMALRHGRIINEIRRFPQQDTMETTGAVASILNAMGRGTAYGAIDVNGIGAGVVDRLRELGFDIFAFNASNRTDQTDISEILTFINLRAAAWWTMRELLDPANGFNIMLPPDDLLIGDLAAPRWKFSSMGGGRIQVESKDDIRKRLGRSTDTGDAVVMAFALAPPAEEDQLVGYEDRVQISPY